jgi:neutral ceramidase
VLAACAAPLSVSVPARVDLPPSAAPLRAGAARVDLTPTPGIPMGGFSIAGKVSRGFWTRLYARALYLEAGGTALALVQTDLMIVPEGLSDRVAELLAAAPAAAAPDTRHIGRENLLLAATETHQSPGGYFTSSFYNDFSSPRAGFDRELFEFLAARIAQAVRGAVADAQGPGGAALLRANHPESVSYTSRTSKLFRNRSLDAFLLNPEAQDYLLANTDLSACATSPLVPYSQACWAVHPRVDFLEVLRAPASGAAACEGVALAVFLAAHSTVLGPDPEVYSGDFFGVAARLLESSSFPQTGCANPVRYPVVALFNGAQGDVSLQWDPRRRTRAELFELAGRLVEKLHAILPGKAAPVARLGFQHELVTPLGGRSVDAGAKRSTAQLPSVGASMLGGAEDGRSVLYEAGMQEGLRGYMRDDHGAKSPPGRFEMGPFLANPAGILVQHVSLPPAATPVAVYRIGDTLIAAVPGELTTLMGERVRALLAKAVTPPVERVLLVGFGNGYLSYLTTPEEYDAQHYEGGFDLYGAATGPFLAQRLAELGSALDDCGTPPCSSPAKPHAAAYWPGSEQSFHVEPGDLGAPPYRVDDGLARIAHGSASPTQLGGLRELPKRNFPTFCWDDSIPRLGDASCPRVAPEVAIRREGSPATYTDPLRGLPQDNDHLAVVTVAGDVGKRASGAMASRWCAIWLSDTAEPLASYRFEVTRIVGTPLTSDPFQPGSLPPDDGSVGPVPVPLADAGPEPLGCNPTLGWLGGGCDRYCKDPGP